MDKIKIAFFDFDKTLTKLDTILLFSHYFFTQQNKKYKYFAVSFLFLFFRFHLISEYSFKEFLCAFTVKGMNESEVDLISQNFFNAYFDKISNPHLISELKTKISDGWMVCIVSSNYDFILKPLYKLLQIDKIISTSTEIADNKFTGKLLGKVCSGNEKLYKVSDCFKIENLNHTVGYGDSKNDYALLNACSLSFLIKYKKVNIFNKITILIKTFWGKFDFTNPHFEIVSFK